MKNKFQLSALGILVVILLLVWAGNLKNSDGLVAALVGPAQVDRFIVPNPQLRLDLLDKISKIPYEGMQRNIFRSTPLPPPVQSNPNPQPVNPTPAEPAKPVDPPWVPPFKYYGYVVDARSGKRRGFFTNGDDIWVVSEGDQFQRRYKLARLTALQADVEEVSSGKRATLQLDESAAPASAN